MASPSSQTSRPPPECEPQLVCPGSLGSSLRKYLRFLSGELVLSDTGSRSSKVGHQHPRVRINQLESANQSIGHFFLRLKSFACIVGIVRVRVRVIRVLLLLFHKYAIHSLIPTKISREIDSKFVFFVIFVISSMWCYESVSNSTVEEGGGCFTKPVSGSSGNYHWTNCSWTWLLCKKLKMFNEDDLVQIPSSATQICLTIIIIIIMKAGVSSKFLSCTF